MTARWRKLLGTIVICAFMAAYIMLATKVSDHVPTHWLAQLAFYIVAGTVWGVPLIPLVRWMNRGR